MINICAEATGPGTFCHFSLSKKIHVCVGSRFDEEFFVLSRTMSSSLAGVNDVLVRSSKKDASDLVQSFCFLSRCFGLPRSVGDGAQSVPLLPSLGRDERRPRRPQASPAD